MLDLLQISGQEEDFIKVLNEIFNGFDRDLSHSFIILMDMSS